MNHDTSLQIQSNCIGAYSTDENFSNFHAMGDETKLNNNTSPYHDIIIKMYLRILPCVVCDSSCRQNRKQFESGIISDFPCKTKHYSGNRIFYIPTQFVKLKAWEKKPPISRVPTSSIMYLSMSSPRMVVVGTGKPRGSRHCQSLIPHPWYLVNVKFLISPLTFLTQHVKIPTLGDLHGVKLPWVAPPPPTLGLNLDRCIICIFLNIIFFLKYSEYD